MDIQVGGWKKRVCSQKIGNKEKQRRAGSQGLESGWRMAGEASAVKTHSGAMTVCGAPGVLRVGRMLERSQPGLQQEADRNTEASSEGYRLVRTVRLLLKLRLLVLMPGVMW